MRGLVNMRKSSQSSSGPALHRKASCETHGSIPHSGLGQQSLLTQWLLSFELVYCGVFAEEQ